MAHRERRALAFAAAAALAVVVWIALPIGVGVLLGTLIAFSVQPAYERLKLRLTPAAAALATVAGTTVVLLATFGGIGWVFVSRGKALSQRLLAELDARGGLGHAVDALARYTSRFGITMSDLNREIRSVAGSAADRTARLAQDVGAATATALLALFFAMLTMHFILRNWEAIARGTQQSLPLRPEYTRALLEEFRRVGRTTLVGTVLTAVAQGIIASIGYWVGGIPEPVFFGLLTALASLVPAVGTLLVWVPLGVVAILASHVLGGIAVLVWGTLFVVGASDYWIRPHLVHGEDELPSLVTFIAIFGGIEAFGLKGLILGPVLMSLAVAVLRLYVHEARIRRAEAPSEEVATPTG